MFISVISGFCLRMAAAKFLFFSFVFGALSLRLINEIESFSQVQLLIPPRVY